MREEELIEKISLFKSAGLGLMSKVQYEEVGKLLLDLSPCNFLVFGLGDDSHLWQEINSEGKNVFLEDDSDWMLKFKDSGLDIRKIDYKTEIKNVNEIGFDENLLQIDLPKDIRETSWDLILVDATLGHGPPAPGSPWENTPGRPFKGPGRMSSIYESSRLIKKGGHVIVDDMGRHVEALYSLRYLGKENLKMLIENKVGIFQV